MKEQSIPFNAPMIRALLEGRKTQTRRIVKPQPAVKDGAWSLETSKVSISADAVYHRDFRELIVGHCPYGKPGDVLWVKENWGYFGGDEYLYQQDIGSVGYRADHLGCNPIPGGRWRSSRFMPRWASRITLDVTGVLVERLQDISEADALAEGMRCDKDTLAATGHATYIDAFRDIWEQINGPGSWEKNPWVWVIEFVARRNK
jgi:hypothetical protein